MEYVTLKAISSEYWLFVWLITLVPFASHLESFPSTVKKDGKHGQMKFYVLEPRISSPFRFVVDASRRNFVWGALFYKNV